MLLGHLNCSVLGENTRITGSVTEPPLGISKRLHPLRSPKISFAVTEASVCLVLREGSFVLSQQVHCQIQTIADYSPKKWVFIRSSSKLYSEAQRCSAVGHL